MDEGKENLTVKQSELTKLFLRLHRAVGPVAGGLILDFVDLATFGPFSIILGPFVGFAVGWWISSIYNFSKPAKVFWSTLAAVYCAIPFTGIVPLATIISAISRFTKDDS